MSSKTDNKTMDKMEKIEKTEKINQKMLSDVCYLIYCALHKDEKRDEERLAKMNLPALYRFAQEQTITSMIYMGLEGTEALKKCSPELARRWEQDKKLAIRRNILLDEERKVILSKMEEAKIWYMPLKGSVLKDLYPRYGMRQMADNDILYDKTYQKELRTLMKSLGYKVESFDRGPHDIYQKPSIYNYEMHTSLFGKSGDKAKYEYYSNVKERLILDTGKKYGFHFTDEDFYIYITAHAYKHFSGGGNGLRCLTDCYVYVSKKGAAMDWDYIERELKKLKLEKFERQCRIVSEKIFGNPDICNLNLKKSEKEQSEPELSKEEWELIYYCATSGTHGTIEHSVENLLREIQPNEEEISFKTKIKYWWSRLYLSRERCEEGYPFFAKYRFLQPFLMLYRIARSGLFRRNEILCEMKKVHGINKSTSRKNKNTKNKKTKKD